jgi:hypothetical protein
MCGNVSLMGEGASQVYTDTSRGGRCRCAFKDIAKTDLEEVEYIRM